MLEYLRWQSIVRSQCVVGRGRDAQPEVHAYARQAFDQAVLMSECLNEDDNTSRTLSSPCYLLSALREGYFTLRMMPGWVSSSSSLR